MVSFLTWFASITAIIYAAVVALLYVGQRHMLYLPTPENNSVNEESVRCQSAGETIKIWRIGTAKKALVYFGGNAEDVALNIPEFKHYFPNHTLYLVNYRGFGGSTGKPTESGLIEDAFNVYDKLKQSHESISVMGRSLGSAVAIQLAAQRDVNKLVLVTPFDSILNVARDIYPIFPVSLLLKDRFDALASVNRIGSSILVLIAETDGIIPRKRTDTLINNIPEDQLSVSVIKDTNHNDIQNSTQYWQALIAFISN